MQTYARSVKRAYGGSGTEAALLGASPLGIIVMLYDGALTNLRRALIAIEEKKIADRAISIGKALDIVNELKLALDHEKGGDLSRNLEDLYNYMIDNLMQGNLNADTEKIQQVINLLDTLRVSWNELEHKQKQDDVLPPSEPLRMVA